ncbi:MAG: alpha/beta fold hydrolase [Holophagales bacterium]|nr:alpha/beta fold hydrolase [Holophagales bacterium]
MGRSKARRKRRTKRSKQEGGSGGGSWLSLLTWASVGFAASRLRRTPSRAALSAVGELGGQDGAETPEPADPAQELRLPEAAEVAWVPGPSGSLRVAQLHADGSLPILFVHGLGGSLDQWAPLLHRAGPGLRAIAIDLPGHGESDAGSVPSIESLAASLGAVADALDLRRYLLVAHSLGAAVALEHASKVRRRVAGVLMIDPNGDQSRIAASEQRRVLESMEEDSHGELGWHFRRIAGDAPEAVVEKVIHDLEAASAATLRQCLAAGFAYSPMPALRAVEGPVRAILSPLNDLPYSLHRLAPDLEVAILPGVGHWLMLEQPDQVWELLLTLVELCRGRLESIH